MSITTALSARRDALRDREAGFTLIELLVVVLIIGILAAIAIPVYLGVQNNAKDSAVKSDLANNKTAITAYATSGTTAALPASGAFSTTVLASLKTYGYGVSSGASFGSYTVGTDSSGGAAFCLVEKSATNSYFYVSSNQPIAKSPTGSTGTSADCGAAGTW